MTRLAIACLLIAGCAATTDAPATPSAAAGVKRISSLDTAKRRPPVAAKHRPGRRSLPVASRSLRRSRLENRPSRSPLPSPLDWPALAQCESGGNPQAATGNGFYGLYQFDLQTWASVGGVGSPADASPTEQTYRAQLLYNERGAAPWPVCGWRLAS